MPLKSIKIQTLNKNDLITQTKIIKKPTTQYEKVTKIKNEKARASYGIARLPATRNTHKEAYYVINRDGYVQQWRSVYAKVVMSVTV